MEEIMKTAILAARLHVQTLQAEADSKPGNIHMPLINAQTALRQMEQTFEQQFGSLPVAET